MNKIFLVAQKVFIPLVISLSLISCVGNNSNSSTSTNSSINSLSTVSLTGISNDLSLESSPDYAKYSVSNIPVGSFGLVGLQLKNIGSSTLSEMHIVSPEMLPEEVTVDYTRTTCYVGAYSADTAIKSLAPNESCNVVLKFEPTKEEDGSLILSMSAINLKQQTILISSDTINFATRYDPPSPTPTPTLTPSPTPTPTIQPGTGKYAYIYGNSPSYCNVDADGNLFACNPLNSSKQMSPFAFYKSRAYMVLNYIGANLRSCNIAANGDFSDCQDYNFPLVDNVNLRAIKFHNNHAYLLDSSESISHLSVCSVDASTGNLSNCNVNTVNTIRGRDIIFNNNYAYVLSNNSISVCSIIDNAGNIGNCNTTAQVPNLLLMSLTFGNGYAYTNDIYLGLWKFTVNPDGALGDRQLILNISGFGYSNKKFYTLKIHNSHAYIVQPKNDSGSVFDCQLQDNIFSNCKNILTDINAWGIQFYNTN